LGEAQIGVQQQQLGQDSLLNTINALLSNKKINATTGFGSAFSGALGEGLGSGIAKFLI
jgi:hypothetical protein